MLNNFRNFWAKMFNQQRTLEDGITPELIRSIIDEVEADPYAGLGRLTRKEMIVDKIYAAWRLHTAIIKGVPVTAPRPIIDEPPAAPAPLPSNFKVTRPVEVAAEVIKADKKQGALV